MKNIIIICIVIVLFYFIYIFSKSLNLFEFFDDNTDYSKKIKEYIDLIDKINIRRINQIPVYYINMDKDIDRKQYMESQLPNHFERYYRIPGVNGKLIKNKNHDIVDGIEFFNEFNDNSVSEIGCTLSHLLSIKTAYDNGEEIACIMEDDVYMNLLNIQDESLDDFVKSVNNNLDWEILQLYHFESNQLDKNFIKIKDYTLHLHNKGNYPCSTGCYIINRKGMEKILSVMGNNPFYLLKKMSVKGVADYIIYDQAKTYIVNPSIIIPNNTELDSTIHTDHKDYHLKKSFNTLSKYKLDLSLSSKIKYTKEYINDINIPKILWSYWDGEIDKLITSCISSWKKNLPDWKIIIINKETLFNYIFIESKYLKIFNSLNIQKKTDLIRLKLLYNYGGCWVDCTTFINRNINEYLYEMIEKNLDIFFPVKGPYTINNAKSWESYFIISSKGSYFTKKMYEKMENVLFKNDSYIKLTKEQENKLRLNNDYHLIYILHLNLLLDNKIYNNSFEQNYSRCYTSNNGMESNLLFNYIIDLHIKYYNNILLSEEELKIIKLYDLLKTTNYQRKYYEKYGVSKIFSYNDVLKDFQNCLHKENNNIDLFK